MVELAAKQQGYLGLESARGSDGQGITVSYWRDEDSILAWKRDTGHQQPSVAASKPGMPTTKCVWPGWNVRMGNLRRFWMVSSGRSG